LDFDMRMLAPILGIFLGMGANFASNGSAAFSSGLVAPQAAFSEGSNTGFLPQTCPPGGCQPGVACSGPNCPFQQQQALGTTGCPGGVCANGQACSGPGCPYFQQALLSAQETGGQPSACPNGLCPNGCPGGVCPLQTAVLGSSGFTDSGIPSTDFLSS
jgi:hypothetical protein